MLPFSELQAVSEKYFNELNPPLVATNPYFPFSPQSSTFASEGLNPDHFLFFSASTTETNTAQYPPPLSPILNDIAANVLDAAMSKRSTTDHDRESNRRKMSTTRKDRHSKICTANGLRDRRMRLSRDVGHKFFNLQDKLGFDKPSKTVQWLLDMSESAIKELCKSASKLVCNSFSHQKSPNDELCISELGEEASSISDSKGKSAALEVNNPTDLVLQKKSKSKRSANHTSRKASINPILKKESRDQARARARERTREKRRMSFLTSPIPIATTIDEEPNSSTCGDTHSKSNKQHMKLIDERNSELEVAAAGGIGLKPMFDYSNQTAITGLNDTFYFFQEQWEMERAFLADVHFYSRAI